jgi:hydrogenase maturation protease
MRTLVAGFGNVLRGDDGFGVEIVRRLLQEGAASQGTVCLEVGTGGVALAQELMTPCDRLVIVDAMARGGAPGSVYVLKVSEVAAARSVDMHMAVPARVLELAQSMGTLPPEVFLVGCEPVVVDELTMEFSDPVRGAIEPALRSVRELLAGAGHE